jgi:hypothetical protein
MSSDLLEPEDHDERHVGDWAVLRDEGVDDTADERHTTRFDADARDLQHVASAFARADERRRRRFAEDGTRDDNDDDDDERSAKRARFYESVRQEGKSALPHRDDSGDFGAFERYTNARGSRLLTKWGWRYGAPIGARGGDVEPVHAGIAVRAMRQTAPRIVRDRDDDGVAERREGRRRQRPADNDGADLSNARIGSVFDAKASSVRGVANSALLLTNSNERNRPVATFDSAVASLASFVSAGLLSDEDEHA